MTSVHEEPFHNSVLAVLGVSPQKTKFAVVVPTDPCPLLPVFIAVLDVKLVPSKVLTSVLAGSPPEIIAAVAVPAPAKEYPAKG